MILLHIIIRIIIIIFYYDIIIFYMMGFHGGSVVKNLPVTEEPQEIQIRSVGQEDPLKKGMATHSNILAWRITWTEEPGRLKFIGLQRARYD